MEKSRAQQPSEIILKQKGEVPALRRRATLPLPPPPLSRGLALEVRIGQYRVTSSTRAVRVEVEEVEVEVEVEVRLWPLGVCRLAHHRLMASQVRAPHLPKRPVLK